MLGVCVLTDYNDTIFRIGISDSIVFVTSTKSCLLYKHILLYIYIYIYTYIYVYIIHYYTLLYTGDIVIKQVNVDSSDSWIVEGVATYEYGGSISRNFEFHCTSTSNDGSGLSWARKDASITKTQTIITDGISLDFDNPDANDAGIYICSDRNSNDDDAVLNITPGKLLPFILYYIN